MAQVDRSDDAGREQGRAPSRRRQRLRRAVLAASVLHDVDLATTPEGVVLDGPRPVTLPWDDVARAHGAGAGDRAHLRLGRWLRLHRLVAELGPAVQDLRPAARLLALPPEHVEHPGPGWVLHRPMGGALECGIAMTGVLGDPDEVVALAPSVVREAGIPLRVWWPGVVDHASTMGHLAVERLRRDTQRPVRVPKEVVDQQLVLRPVGGIDVPTLLATHVVRRYLASSDGSGMRATAVPMRSRGWYDLSRIDPAFVVAAWSATDDLDKGLPRPLLVTADEVALAPVAPAGSPARIHLPEQVRRFV